jgi:mRNA-degrading endonuclease RelE of RelBE toxin-antitoxin system
LRYRVGLSSEAQYQRAVLPPGPKRRVNELVRELKLDPYGSISLRLTLVRDEIVYRVREDGYRLLFRPGPGRREITIFRIALREVAYEGFEHPDSRD